MFIFSHSIFRVESHISPKEPVPRKPLSVRRIFKSRRAANIIFGFRAENPSSIIIRAPYLFLKPNFCVPVLSRTSSRHEVLLARDRSFKSYLECGRAHRKPRIHRAFVALVARLLPSVAKWRSAAVNHRNVNQFEHPQFHIAECFSQSASPSRKKGASASLSYRASR